MASNGTTLLSSDRQSGVGPLEGFADIVMRCLKGDSHQADVVSPCGPVWLLCSRGERTEMFEVYSVLHNLTRRGYAEQVGRSMNPLLSFDDGDDEEDFLDEDDD